MKIDQKMEEEAFEEDKLQSSKDSTLDIQENMIQKLQKSGRTVGILLFAIIGLIVFNILAYIYWQGKYQNLKKIEQISTASIGQSNPEDKLKLKAQLKLANNKVEFLEKEIKSILSSQHKQVPVMINTTTVPKKQIEYQRIPAIKREIVIDNSTLAPMPLNLSSLNAKNQTIDEVLYNKAERQERKDYHSLRNTFINGHTNFPSIILAKYNQIHSADQATIMKIDMDRDWNRLEKKFQLSKITTELPMCIVSPGFNNNAKFRIEYNLNSIFTQNYTNYKVIIINDASTDGSGESYRKYLEFYNINPKHYTYIQNSQRLTALENIYYATTKYCRKDSIVITLDADDEFIGRNVLKVFNWGYQVRKVGVLYSNFYWFDPYSTLKSGFTGEYSPLEKRHGTFRKSVMKFSQLRSYRAELFLQINVNDLQDQQGNFFTIAYDIAIFLPLMELSCGRVEKIDDEYHYLYNFNTGINDSIARDRQIKIDNLIRGYQPYKCYQPFEDRMKKSE